MEKYIKRPIPCKAVLSEDGYQRVDNIEAATAFILIPDKDGWDFVQYLQPKSMST